MENWNIVRKLLIAVFVVWLACPLRAENFYISQTMSGNGTGADASNTKAVSFLNTSSNWSTTKVAGKVGPGDTIHLVGTLTTAFTVQAGGTSSAGLTVLFEPGAKMSNPAFPNTGAIQLYSGLSYVTIDGGATGLIGGPNGNAANVNGIIENTDNGTNLANKVNSVGVWAPEAKHVTVKNLAIYNLYVRTRGGDGNSGGIGIGFANVNGSGLNNIAVTNCLLHDLQIGVSSDYGIGDHTYEFSFLTVYNCNWGGSCGDRGANCTQSGLKVHDNWFYSFTNWDDTANNNNHHNGFYAWGESGGTLTNPTFYNNKIGPGFGGPYQTSGLFISGKVAGSMFYNNLFVCGSGEYAANGMITGGSAIGGTHRVYSNTFIGGSGIAVNLSGTGVTLDYKNNLANGCSTVFAIFNNSGVTLNSDYNLWYNTGASPFIYSSNGSGVYKTPAQWTQLGYDTHSLMDVNPVLDANYVPLAGSPALLAGLSLSSYFTTDMNGTTRPNLSLWTIGSIQGNGSPAATAPASAITSITVH